MAQHVGVDGVADDVGEAQGFEPGGAGAGFEVGAQGGLEGCFVGDAGGEAGVAEVLGDATLKPKQREARLAKNAKDEQEALAAAKQLRAEATTDRAPWLTAEEKAALAKGKLDASAAASKAAKQLSLAQRAKKAGVRGQRWLQALTSLGLTPNPEENDEKEEAAAPTLTSLLPLAQQFQARDQGMALQALRDPDVQQGAAAANAVKAIRAEAREALLKDITADYKDGNPLGVMTVADQAQFLKDQGVNESRIQAKGAGVSLLYPGLPENRRATVVFMVTR